MDWGKDTVLSFLCLIRDQPALWDKSSQEYRDKHKKHAAIEKIAAVMRCSPKTVSTKWVSLKNQYSREKRNINGTRSGSGCKGIYVTKWYAFKEMEYLIDNPEMKYNCSDESLSYPPTSRSPSTPTQTQEISYSFSMSPFMQQPSAPTTPLLQQPSALPTPIILQPTTAPTPPIIKSPSPPPMMQLPSRSRSPRLFVRKNLMRNEHLSPNNNIDDLTSFGLYVAAYVRKFDPRLQCRAKYEINKMLYKLDMQSLGGNSSDCREGIDDQDSNEDQADQQIVIEEYSNASSFKQ